MSDQRMTDHSPALPERTRELTPEEIEGFDALIQQGRAISEAMRKASAPAKAESQASARTGGFIAGVLVGLLIAIGLISLHLWARYHA